MVHRQALTAAVVLVTCHAVAGFAVPTASRVSVGSPAGLRPSSIFIASQTSGLRGGGSARSLRMEASDSHFELLVIGGGSGGIACAKRAAGYGAKVGLVEKQALGGTCVNVGCVPKKVMWNAATVNEIITEAKHFGYKVDDYQFDWNFLKQLRDKYITRLNGIYANGLDSTNVQRIEGFASFKDATTVNVEGKELTADHIVVAVGGKPTMPDLPGVEHCISSNGFFELEEQPKKVAVIGAGYIAVELAGVFQALHSDTTLLVRKETALSSFDDMIKEELDAEMKKAGMTVKNHSNTAKIVKDEATGLMSLELESGETLEGFDCVLMAVGRGPLTEKLNLGDAGVEVDQNGFIKVDDFQNTNVEGVYALGDVIDRHVDLTPMAIAAGRRLADRLFNGDKDAKADYTNVPTAIFSHPPIGVCGLTEGEAREKYGDDAIKVYKSRFTNLWYGPWDMEPEDKPKTAMKLVCVGEDEKVVGLHSIGMGSDELLQGFGIAMKMGATKADFDSCVAIHPTAAEELVTLAPWGKSGQS